VTESTRWLTADEQRCWRAFLNACQTLFGQIDAQLLRDSGMPHGYYEILAHLSEAPGRALRMTQLAEAATFSKSRLSHAVTRLEERGLVVRQSCPTDRRGQIASLTDEGFAVLAAAAPGHVTAVRKALVEALTPDQISQLREISEAIVAAGADRMPQDRELAGCPGSDEPEDAICPGTDPARALSGQI
jgi:DNA-binding MarR family transcriptional regulator